MTGMRARFRRRRPDLSVEASDYLESLALGLPMKVRTPKARPMRLYNTLLAAAIVSAIGALIWFLIPPGPPASDANQNPPWYGVTKSPCSVSGENLHIKVPCAELNEWLNARRDTPSP